MKLGVFSLTLKHEHTHHERVFALPVTSLFINGYTLNTGSKSASSFTQCWCARYFMYPCWERTKVVYSRGGGGKDCTMYPAFLRYLKWFKAVFNIYGFNNGAVIIHTCMYIGMYLSFVCPNLHSHKQMLPFLVLREQCTSREVSYYNKVIQRRQS